MAYSTGRVSAIVDNVDASRTQTLTYDDRGNITQLSETNRVLSTYTYDDKNRVISDSTYYNQWFNTYTYNEKYNAIASKYSSNTINYGPEPVSTEYTYNNLGQLTVMTENGVNKYFAYDALGNPTKYKTSSPTAQDNLVWTQGRYLTSGTLNGNTFSYEYDASGTRYKKTVNGQTTEFYISNGRILAQRTVDFLMGNLIDYYFYDSTGVIGMYYAANGEYFTFEKNALGDVVRVLDSLGNEMAYYDYDAWGNMIGEGGVAAHIFPFRYRGYYYDAETGFYYLQSRYYDPSTMRFINADDYELAETLMADPGQLYVYNYCNNNPVMYTDESGQFIFTLIIGAVVGAIVSGGFAVIGQLIKYGSNTSLWEWDAIIIAMIGGAISGAFGATGINMWGQAFINAGIGVAQYSASTIINNGTFDIGEMLISAVLGFISGRAGGNGATYFAKELKEQIQNNILKVTPSIIRKNLVNAILKASLVGFVAQALIEYRRGKINALYSVTACV